MEEWWELLISILAQLDIDFILLGELYRQPNILSLISRSSADSHFLGKEIFCRLHDRVCRDQ